MAMAPDNDPVDPLIALLKENARLSVALQVEKLVSQEHWNYYEREHARTSILSNALREILDLKNDEFAFGSVFVIARKALNG